ncbi:MAG: serine/threonine-protein kinase [Myxococcales bacterium]
MVGTELGPYRLVALLGSGGMGMVFVGEHRMLGRRMAIKVLLPDLASRLDIVQRFFKEAKSANEIAHENIVEIFDFVQQPDGISYLVMELLSGHDLGVAAANEGPFKLSRTLRITRQIAAALAAAHDKRIVHRDLKPENIFLIRRQNDPDFVKLLDFGLAKVPESQTGIPSSTQTGVVMGTPEYMSPEQAMGVSVDVRSDIYSLAVVLYWLVSGKLPFDGASFEQQRRARVSSPAPPLPPLSAAGEPVPPELAALVARCLARPPEDRCQNGREFLEALEKLPVPLQSPSLPPAPGPAAPTGSPSTAPKRSVPPRRRLGRWAVVAGVAAASAAGIGWVVTRPSAPAKPAAPPPRPVAQAAAPPPPAAPVVQLPPPAPLPAAPPREPLVRTTRKKIAAPSKAKAKRKGHHGTPEPLLPFPE